MDDESSVRQRLVAGIVDTGFSSLATFIVGLTAVVRFDDIDRGAYALFFTAFVMGELIANEWIFTPVEVEAVSLPVDERLTLVRRSLVLGVPPCAIGSMSGLVALGLTQAYTAAPVAAGLAVTTVLLVFLSTIQSHLRRMLHIASRSSIAAGMSVVQCGVVVGSVVFATAVEVPLAWIPFGALAIANAVSMASGLWVVRHRIRGVSRMHLRFWDLSRRGVWFIANGAASAVAGFVIAAAIAWLASPEELGYAESARIVAQPILVLAGGLAVVLRPRAMRAGLTRDLASARTTSRLYLGVLLGSGGLYLVVVGWTWLLNPFASLVPSAYVTTGLVALAVGANVVAAATFLQNEELAGAARERTLAIVAWVSSIFLVGGGLTAGFTGAYARSVGLLGGATVRLGLQSRILTRMYRSGTGVIRR